MTFAELQSKLCWLVINPEEWHQHPKGRGWVQNSATIEPSATVKGIVFGDAWVFDNAWVSGDAWVFGDARVSGNAWVSGDARVSGNAWVSGNARVFDNAWVSGDARVSGDAWVFDNARVSGNAWVSGNARVSGDAWVFGNAWVSGDARVSGDAWGFSPLQIQGSRHFVTTCSHAKIQIGCQCHSVAEWQESFKNIDHDSGYTPDQISEYGLLIALCADWLKLKFSGTSSQRDAKGRFLRKKP